MTIDCKAAPSNTNFIFQLVQIILYNADIVRQVLRDLVQCHWKNA